MDDITRVCRKCGQEKPLEEFAKNKECVLGHSHICKQCTAEQSRKWHAANFEKAREKHRKWRAANLEKCREYDRKYYAANSEKCREYDRKYYAANSEKCREYARKYYAANSEKAREKHRKWRAANLEKYRANASKYYAANLEMYRAYDRKKRENLTDGYLMDKLKRCNLPVTPETIDYKRIQLKLYREIKKQQNDERD